ncbi:hypothetical protein N7499_011523 [Penicillium canescens]|nr:hypothetical protein N7499_011523 [Penicillium canescens]KAJ6182312.1 hypothetical protein N7485_000954 [Penicillium canescens]
MHFPARHCAPIVSAATATGRISRGIPYASLRLGSAGWNACTGKGSGLSTRHIHLISRRDHGFQISGISPAKNTQCVAAPSNRLGWSQFRSFSQADHSEVSGDNQKTEELLEKFEVQEGNQEARPQRNIISEDGKGEQSVIQGEEWPERMTKGMDAMGFIGDY